MPSTLLSIAFWMRLACSGICPELLYLMVTLSLAAASAAPFWITSKKASPSGAWLIKAKVYAGVAATAPPPPAAAAAVSFAAPPLLLHAAVVRSTRPAATPTSTRCLVRPNIVVPSVVPGRHLLPVMNRL